MAKGNPLGQVRAKPFREALNMEIADSGGDPKRLRRIAVALLEKAEEGDIAAIKEIADRLDGKVPQGIGGAEDLPPIETHSLTDEDVVRRLAHIMMRADEGKKK